MYVVYQLVPKVPSELLFILNHETPHGAKRGKVWARELWREKSRVRRDIGSYLGREASARGGVF